MALQKLDFKVAELAYALEQGQLRHAEQIEALRAEAKALRSRAREASEKCRKPRPHSPPDDTLFREVEWRIQQCSDKVSTMPKNEALWSEHFTIMGIRMQLEFFPHGRDTTWMPGFCALFLWCPAGVHLRYRLRVGSHWMAPDVDDFPTKMGHGHSNFCFLDAQLDKESDSVTVGVQILEVSSRDDVGTPADGLRVINQGPERALLRATEQLSHQGFDRVEWRIRNVPRRLQDIPAGSAMYSPMFCLCGVQEMLLELYPNGVQPRAEGATSEKQGYCGFYVRCPSSKPLVITLFVGTAKKGPIRTSFDGNAAKGLPEFCRLTEQLVDGEDVVCGVEVQNPALDAEAQERTITLPRQLVM